MSEKTVGYWPEGDVYVALPGTPLPEGGEPLSDAFAPAGYLSPDDGFSEKINFQSKSAFAWKKGKKVATSRDQLAIQRSFTYLEDNEVTRDMVWGGGGLPADVDGSYSGYLSAPDLDREFVLVFEMVKAGRVKRASTAGFAQIADIGDEKVSASDLGGRQLTMDIFSDDQERYWKVYDGPIQSGSGGGGGGGGGGSAVVGITGEVDPIPANVGDTGQVTVFAVHADSSQSAIAAGSCVFSTTDPDVLTVNGAGLVTATGVGTASITFSSGGFDTEFIPLDISA